MTFFAITPRFTQFSNGRTSLGPSMGQIDIFKNCFVREDHVQPYQLLRNNYTKMIITNAQWKQLFNLYVYNNPRRVDMPLKSISQWINQMEGNLKMSTEIGCFLNVHCQE